MYSMPQPEPLDQPEAINQPPLEDIPEFGPEQVVLSPEKYFDELDPLATPPGLAQGVYVSDEVDQLTTPPPGLSMPMPVIDRSNDRPPSYHFLPFTSAYDEFPLPPAQLPEIPESTVLMQAEVIDSPPSDRKEKAKTSSENAPSMIGEEDQAKLGGVPTKAAASGRGSFTVEWFQQG
jgi:hypothetical protein